MGDRIRKSFQFLVSAVTVTAAALPCALLATTPAVSLAQAQLSGCDLERIGKRIWQNEAAGSVEGLTSWNSGEDFASLGIGHFIWYPAGPDGPFEESFPQLIA